MKITNNVKASAYWHFRINDLSEEQFNHLKNLGDEIDWIVIGEIEVGDIAKGQHYHCAVKFRRSYELAKVKRTLLFNQKLIPDIHYWLEPKHKNSTITQFVNYVIKNGLRFKMGFDNEITEEVKDNMIVEPKSKDDYKKELTILRQQHAAMGDIQWFRDNDAKYMCTAEFNRLLVWAQPDATETLNELENYYIWGDSGTGKSSSINFLYPGCYKKIKNNDKHDSYFNLDPAHKTYYLDEMDNMENIDIIGGYEFIKSLADVYPVAVRQNYGNRVLMIRPKRVIITSNYSPNHVFASPNKYGRKMGNLEMNLRTFYRKFKVLHITEWQKLKGIKFDPIIKRTVWDKPPGGECSPAGKTDKQKEKENNRNMNMEDARYWNEDEC